MINCLFDYTEVVYNKQILLKINISNNTIKF